MGVTLTAYNCNLIALHGTLHRNRQERLFHSTNTAARRDGFEHNKEALILKWAMKYCRLLLVAGRS